MDVENNLDHYVSST